MRSPSPYLDMDETFYPYRGSVGIKQYNPNKVTKYELLYCSLCDTVAPYTYYTLPYDQKTIKNKQRSIFQGQANIQSFL